MHQEFNGSVWLKGEVVQSYAPVVETFKPKRNEQMRMIEQNVK